MWTSGFSVTITLALMWLPLKEDTVNKEVESSSRGVSPVCECVEADGSHLTKRENTPLDAFSLGCRVVINTYTKNRNRSPVSPTEWNIAAHPLPFFACTCVKFEIKAWANFNENNYGYPPYLCHSPGLPEVSMGAGFYRHHWH